MSAREQLELDIVVKIASGQITRKQGQKILGVSERTLRRHLRDYDKNGALFIKHGNSGRAPINRRENELKERVLKLVREKYFDFNLTHCLEKLRSEEGIQVGREAFRLWCHGIGMVKKARRRTARVRRLRQRMQQTGLMLQMDGSPHAWFGGKVSCLIAAIDDADSDVPYGEFFPAEDTISCLEVLRKIIEKRGIFQLLYVDRAGIYGGPKRANFSQVKRALGELGIQVIFANSPEAKGRIERLWGTFQDRLIPEMRLRDIRSYERANEFLQEQFLPNEYATRFKVVPENLQTAYKPVPKEVNLREIFCIKEDRMVKRDHTFSLNDALFRIDSELKHSIYKQKIEVRTYTDLSRRFFFAGKPIEVSRVVARPKQGNLVLLPAPAGFAESNALSIIAQANEPGQKVRQDGHAIYQGKYYSVSENFVGKSVQCLEKEGLILLSHRGKIIESHTKVKGHETHGHSTKPEHMGPWKRAQERSSIYRQGALRLGGDVDRFIEVVLLRGQGFVDTGTIFGVLNLDQTYTARTINEACQVALDLDTITYRAVQRLAKLHGSRLEQQNRAVAK
jgi:transposase